MTPVNTHTLTLPNGMVLRVCADESGSTLYVTWRGVSWALLPRAKA